MNVTTLLAGPLATIQEIRHAPVTSACFSSGFSNLSHFSRSFSRRYGVTPSQFSSSRREPRGART